MAKAIEFDNILALKARGITVPLFLEQLAVVCKELYAWAEENGFEEETVTKAFWPIYTDKQNPGTLEQMAQRVQDHLVASRGLRM